MKVIITFLFFFFLLANSCNEVFEESLDNEQVILKAPVDSIVSSESIQAFYWLPFDSGTKYELLIVSPRFDSIERFVTDTIVQKNQFQLSLQSGEYQWKVRAFNFSSSTQYSLPWNFKIH
jgi:hypothetical protein